MTITHSGNIITIDGNIKSISDYQTIKSTIDGVVSTHKSIILNIIDSISITSSVIGYFNKLVLKDGITIEMRVGNPQLMELLDELNLKSIFHASRI